MSLDLVTRLFLDTENYDKNLEKSKKNLTSFENQCKTYGSTISNFAPKIGNLISVAGKLSPAFVAAGVGMGVFNTKINESESFTDFFNSTVEQSKAKLDEFQRRVFSLDFGNMIKGLQDASHQAQMLYDALDNLGTLQLFSGPAHKKNMADMEKATNKVKEARAKGDKKAEAAGLKEFDTAWKSEIGEIKRERKAQEKVVIASVDKISNVISSELDKIGIDFKPDQLYIAKFLANTGKGGFLDFQEKKQSEEKDWYNPTGQHKVTLDTFAKGLMSVLRKGEWAKYGGYMTKQLKDHGYADAKTFLTKYIASNLNEEKYYEPVMPQITKWYDYVVQEEAINSKRNAIHKKEWAEEKKNTTSTSKSVKTYKEAVETFESIVNSMRSSNNLASSQYKEGFMSQVEYYSALKSNLDSAIKGLMSDKIWTTLTDAQKQELQSMQKTSTILGNFLNEYKNNKNEKNINTDLTDLSDIYTNWDILNKGRKSVFFGRLVNSEGLTDEGAENQAQRNISDNIYDLYYQRYGTKLPDYNNGELAEILTDGSGIFTYMSDEAQEYYDKLDIYTKKKLDELMDLIKRGLSNVTAFSSQDAFEYDETLFYQQNPSANRRDFLAASISASEKVRLKLDEENEGYQTDIDELKEQIANREDLYVNATIQLDETAKQRLLDEITELDKKVENLQNKINKNKLKIDTNAEGVKKAKEEIDELDKQKKQVRDFSDAFGTVSYAFSTAGDAAEEFGNESAGTALKMVGIGAQLAASIANIIGMTLTEAGANAVNSASKIGYPQNIIAIGSALAAVMAAAAQVHSLGTKKYAHGGIVEGIGSSFSDSIPIMVSNGEMVLNKGQQRNLFNLLDRGEGVSSLSSGDVTFRIKGNVMEGTLKNHNSQMRKIR
jgi:hypothetical protein